MNADSRAGDFHVDFGQLIAAAQNAVASTDEHVVRAVDADRDRIARRRRQVDPDIWIPGRRERRTGRGLRSRFV